MLLVQLVNLLSSDLCFHGPESHCRVKQTKQFFVLYQQSVGVTPEPVCVLTIQITGSRVPARNQHLNQPCSKRAKERAERDTEPRGRLAICGGLSGKQTDDVIEMESLLFRRTNRMKLRGPAGSSTEVLGVVQAWRCSVEGMLTAANTWLTAASRPPSCSMFG